MTAPEEPIRAAASWLAAQAEPPAHVVPAMKQRFGLTGLQACQAIALARNAATPDAEDQR